MQQARLPCPPGRMPARPQNLVDLFAYGSNSTCQIQRRAGSDDKLTYEPGILPDHARIFAGHSKRWGGAVASVHPCMGMGVGGIVVRLPAEALAALDEYEGGYTRRQRTVLTQGGPVKAHMYVKDRSEYRSPPSDAYLQAVGTTLAQGNFPCIIPILVVRPGGSVSQLRDERGEPNVWTPSLPPPLLGHGPWGGLPGWMMLQGQGPR
jgi:gamma-glutamylcyclotransferase